MSPVAGCPLCEEDGGRLVLRTPRLRVIRAEDDDFPAFYRVVWQDHVAEWSDLPAADQALTMAAVTAVERTLRAQLRPTKVNLASLGNAVPHLHWHVVARFDWDSRFPQPVWAPAQRAVDPPPLQRLSVVPQALDDAVKAAVAAALAPSPPGA
ncbi:HIT family protein [Aquabacterium sp. J223]|uniref:HIT family protein n=1 Tax=Aquabacterium sp. J223 TaxID=2898431 RepID=UPI0021AE22AF|nr:HIT family protein [Aquabacterium sp. J223]UUX96840.1 HIT family protein [Aquabacterium sp. J223]